MAEEKKTPEEKETAPKAEKAADKKTTAPEKADKTEEKESKAKAPKGKPAKKGGKKAKRRIVTEGRVYIQASFNNTIVTITDEKGDVLASSSCGANGFKGPKKATPYAAQVTSERAVEKAKVYGVERVHVYIKGAGNGREQAMRGLQSGGLAIETITDQTAIAHNGCRPKKSRRV